MNSESPRRPRNRSRRGSFPGLVLAFASKDTLERFLVRRWDRWSREAVEREGRFTVALSGGRTPATFYERLAAEGAELPWDRTHVFLADERLVPSGDPASNLGMIRERLLDRVPISHGNVHPVPSAPKPSAAAKAYEGVIRAFFALRTGGFPRLDLVLLGVGADGHTASLFPGDPGLKETKRLTVAVGRTAPDHDRVSLTLPVINHARIVVFMVTGADKSSAVRAVVAGPPGALPASRVRPTGGQAYLLLDSGAASRLGATRPVGRTVPDGIAIMRARS